MRERIIEILKEADALMEGHFMLSSGRHSNRYVQCAKVMRYPHLAEEVLKPVVDKVKELNVDKVVGPAMGGIVVAYEMGRQLQKEAIFTERKDGEMQLRRGFEINKGDRVIITEDVVTTGKSTMEVKRLLESMGAEVLGVTCIIDRRAKDLDIGMDVFGAIQLEIESFEAEECELCKQGIEIKKPGSRFSK